MQNYVVSLQSEPSVSFRSNKAANSLDIDVKKKLTHTLNIEADLDTPFNIGLVVGASGSGKTTLIKKMFGEDCLKEILDLTTPIIDQFSEELNYDECASALSGIGLTSVPCWIRPAATLSNGQKARAEAALQIYSGKDFVVLDEWTSVVDRNVAKVMSHCVQKFARKNNKKFILCSCHYDVMEWLNPDFVIDCNKQQYIERRSMVGSHTRTDQLRLDVKEVGRSSWRYFSKYHYLSDRLPGGKIYTYGLFSGDDQIGFQCFASYIIGDHKTFFSNRTVIHPDYAGLGLGINLINETSKLMVQKGFRIKAKFSSTPIYKAMARQDLWRCTKIDKPIKKPNMGHIRNVSEKSRKRREDSIRSKQITYHFDFVWKNKKTPN